MKPYPTNEFKLTKYAAFLAETVKTVETIKRYCGTICQEHELAGFPPVRRGVRFYRTITGIRKELRHKVKRAEPMTIPLLEKIGQVVNYHDDKQLVVWVSLVTGFHLILRKSNLVPLKRVHDAFHQITRNDIRYHKGVMVACVRWTKTNKFCETIAKTPMIVDNNKFTCLVRWIWYMTDRIPAHPQHNLFCFRDRKHQLVPITYRDLMTQLRDWLDKIGVVNVKRFSGHSLRRGGTSMAFNRNLPEKTIMHMGGWSSDCYKRYIEIGVAAKIRTWTQFTKK